VVPVCTAFLGLLYGGISWDQAIQDLPNEVQTVLAAYWQPPA
jgi:hypothetical protein